jgi:hypothetical protein
VVLLDLGKGFRMQSLDREASSHEGISVGQAAGAVETASLLRYWLPAILLLAVFAFSVPTIPSADMWWHLSTGRFVVQNHSVPHSEPFSATIAGKPWTAHEWLSGVVFYLAYSALGSAGPLFLTAFVLTLAFWFAYQRSGAPLLARVFALALGVSAAAPIFSVRPQIFTYLLASIFLLVLTCYFQAGSYKLLLWLPPLTILWVNFHGGYVIGLTIILLFAAGAVCDWIAGLSDAITARRRVASLLLTCVACLLAVPLNPNGLALYVYPLVTLRSWGAQTDIMEWRSPDFHLSIFRPFAALLLLTVAVLALSPKRPKPSQVLLFVFFALAALYGMRNLPFFVLVAFPLLAEYAFLPAWRFPALSIGLRLTLQVVVLFLVAVASAQIATGHVGAELDREQFRFPARATSFLDTQKLPAPLFNSYDFGGYLIWRLYPRYRVYIDGRTDLYGHAFFDEFLQVYQVNVDPRPILDRDGIRTVLVEPQSSLARFLRTQVNWKLVYEDPTAVIFSR